MGRSSPDQRGVRVHGREEAEHGQVLPGRRDQDAVGARQRSIATAAMAGPAPGYLREHSVTMEGKKKFTAQYKPTNQWRGK
jgi:hypothetical protein